MIDFKKNQQKINPIVTRTMLRVSPNFIADRIIRSKAPAMIQELSDLGNVVGGEEEINGKFWPTIRFPGKDNLTLIGQEPTRYECLMFKNVIKHLGLSEEYTRVCIDYVTRFKHPHMAVGFDTIDSPPKGRFSYHPQHLNLAQECQCFSDELKARLVSKFTPELGWKVLDVGAYLGHGSLWMSKRIGDQGRIISVEATEENSAFIRRHCSLNRRKNWTHRQGAIWHKGGETISFQRTLRQQNAISEEVVAGSYSEEVTTTAVPELIDEVGGSVDLLSLTVNGAEIEALEGMNELGPAQLPKRILTPGWYLKDGRPRADFIEPILSRYGYQMAKTPGHFIFAWV